jgi:hypothetical protein
LEEESLAKSQGRQEHHSNCGRTTPLPRSAS